MKELPAFFKASAAHYDFFELWLDGVEDFEVSQLENLVVNSPRPLILVWDRGRARNQLFDDKVREQVLRTAVNLPHIWLDLDLVWQDKELSLLKSLPRKCQLLLSFHDYDKTPESEKLQAMLFRMQEFQPSAVKVATYCQGPDDTLRLLVFLRELVNQRQPCVILGMGEYGQATRIYGSQWGNLWSYAPLTEEQASAPGQLTLEALRTIERACGP